MLQGLPFELLLREAVFQGWEKHFSKQRVGTGFESQHEREGGDFCGTVRNGVVVEFGCSEEFHPFLGIVGTEDSEIGLNSWLARSICPSV